MPAILIRNARPLPQPPDLASATADVLIDEEGRVARVAPAIAAEPQFTVLEAGSHGIDALAVGAPLNPPGGH